nr:probable alpha,alpha-trehalose-phosphate synthase [UDP-forming] 9 [Tanacetum cinerariifolium]
MIENGQLPDFIACIGDDRSDEDMFKSIMNTAPNTPEIFSCTVGRKPSKAKYYLDDTVDVKLLSGLANASDDTIDVKLLSGLANTSDPKPSYTPARFQVTFDAVFERRACIDYIKENGSYFKFMMFLCHVEFGMPSLIQFVTTTMTTSDEPNFRHYTAL